MGTCGLLNGLGWNHDGNTNFKIEFHDSHFNWACFSVCTILHAVFSAAIMLDCHWNKRSFGCCEMVSRELPVSCKISFSDHVYNFRNEFSDPETIGKYTLTMPRCLIFVSCLSPVKYSIRRTIGCPKMGTCNQRMSLDMKIRANTIKIAAEITSLAIIAVIS